MKPDFLIIPKTLTENKNLTPSDWIVYAIVYWFERMKEGKCVASNDKIAEVANLKSRSVRASLERLEAEKYIKRLFQSKNKKTRMEIKTLVAYGEVGTVEPTSDVGMVVPQGRLNHCKKVGTVEPHNSNIDIVRVNSTSAQGAEYEKTVADLIDAFKIVNPSYKTLFSRNSQRNATKRLFDQFGEEKLRKVIAYLPTSNSSKFAPTITTPVELENKIGALIAHVQKERSSKNIVGIAI